MTCPSLKRTLIPRPREKRSGSEGRLKEITAEREKLPPSIETSKTHHTTFPPKQRHKALKGFLQDK